MTSLMSGQGTVEVSNASNDAGGASRWVVMLSSTAVFLIALELTIISVALPRIEDAFPDSSRATLSWVFTAYNVGVASLLLIGGWLAERHGRKMIFLIGLVVFTVGSLVSGLAPTVAVLIIGRAIQSIGGAFLLPASLALVLHSVADNKRDAAIGIWGAMAGLAAAVGPTLGAVLVEYAGWRSVFLINVPIAVFAIIKGRTLLLETRDPNAPTRVDLVAVPLGAAGTGLLVFAVVAAGPLGFADPKVIASLCGAVLLLGVFLHRSRRHRDPVFPLELARRQSYRVGLLGTGLFGAGFAGWLILAPTFLVDVWDYSVLRAGLAIAPAPLAMAVTAGPAGNLASRIGYRRLISIGSLIPIAAIASWVVWIGREPAYVTAFLPGAILLGIGVGIGFPMLTAACMRDVEPGRYAMGAAGNTTFRQVAIALGISGAIAIVGSGSPGGGAPSVDRFALSWIVCGVLFALTSALIAFAYPNETTLNTTTLNKTTLNKAIRTGS